MRKLYAALLVVALMIPCFAVDGASRKKKKSKSTEQVEVKKEKPKSKYAKLVKKTGIVTVKGDFVTLHRDGEKIYVEYPLRHMGRQILMGGTLSKVSDPQFINVGYKNNNPLHLRVDLQDSTVVFSQPNMMAVCTSDDENMRKAMSQNYMDKEFRRFSVEAYNEDSTAVVFNATDLFKCQEVSPFITQGMIIISSGKTGKPYFGEMKAFDDNASVVLNQNVDVSISFFIFRFSLGTTAASSTISLLLLPEEKMKPRIQDSRIGVFPTYGHEMLVLPKRDLAQVEDGMRTFAYANRWRLEPKDVEAWKRGELVEPKKPIVWYVDDAFPEAWKPAIRKAVLRWNPAFEKIGFKNVMQVHDFPKNDTTFDPDNLKYSCIRYSPSPVANAMGPSWVDPTTGEILNASVIVYNDVIKLNNHWRFIQTAQIDPRVRAKKMPKEVLDESIEYVIAHEIGHTLGMMHNMAGSNAYPVDSLRSVSFTQKYGTTPSIMDYARFNYVAQPGDEGVKLTPPNLGVYDEYVIKWLYTPILDAKNMWEEAEIAGRWIDEKAGDVRFRYGRQQIEFRYDPSSFEEDLGNDPIKAGNYGVKNLKYIFANLNNWIDEKDDVRHRGALYGGILEQYYRYLNNVLYQVGGMRLTQVKPGTCDVKPTEVLSRGVQKASLKWVLNEIRNCAWVNAPELTKDFDLNTNSSSKLATLVAKSLWTTIPVHVTLASHVATGKEVYTVREYFDDVYAGVFATPMQKAKLTLEEKIMQRSMIDGALKDMEKGKKAASSLAGEQGLPRNYSALPSLEEIEAYGLYSAPWMSLVREQLQEIEDQYGKGIVAAACLSQHFGDDTYPFQGEVKIDDISEIPAYQTLLLKKVLALVKGKMASANRDDKAHYELLAIRIETALKK